MKPRLFVFGSVCKRGRARYLYFIANQLHRQPAYHDGKDLRAKPYGLFRVRIDGTPVRLDENEKQVVREKQTK